MGWGIDAMGRMLLLVCIGMVVAATMDFCFKLVVLAACWIRLGLPNLYLRTLSTMDDQNIKIEMA